MQVLSQRGYPVHCLVVLPVEDNSADLADAYSATDKATRGRRLLERWAEDMIDTIAKAGNTVKYARGTALLLGLQMLL